MDMDFQKLIEEDYILYLTSPVYSKNEVNLVLRPTDFFTDTITIVNKGEGLFKAYVESTDSCLKVDRNYIEGNDISLTYQLRMKDFQAGTIFSAALIFTYLGGEKEIPFRVEIAEEEQLREEMKEAVVESKKHLSKEQPTHYEIQFNKRAFDLDEKARLTIMNKSKYPLSVWFSNVDSELEIGKERITIGDYDSFEVGLKKSIFDFFNPRRKSMTSPVIEKILTLEIEVDGQLYKEKLNLVFTNYKTILGRTKIKNEKTYREVELSFRRHFVKYIVNRERSLLKKCIEESESLMTYHPTDMNLKLLYLLCLLDYGEEGSVNEQVMTLTRYDTYYEEKGFEEFIDIIEVLYLYLRGEEYSYRVRQWPMTLFRQLYKIHLFESDKISFKDLENLYNRGIQSVYLYGESVYLMNKSPEIPNGESAYFHIIISWALNKGWIGSRWFDRLEQGYYMVFKNKLLTSDICRTMYEERPSDNLLKLLAMIYIEESNDSMEAFYIYTQAIKKGVFLKGLMTSYAKSAYENSQKPYLAFDHIAILYNRIDSIVMAYVLVSYIEGTEVLNSSQFTWINRMSMQIIKDESDHINKENLAKYHSIIELVIYVVKGMVYKQQWQDLKELLTKPLLPYIYDEEKELIEAIVYECIEKLDYVWLENQLMPIQILHSLNVVNGIRYIDYLINKGQLDTLIELFPYIASKGFEEKTISQIIQVIYQYNNDIGYRLATDTYDKGISTSEFLLFYASVVKGTLKVLIEVEEKLKKNEIFSYDLAMLIILKGIIIRREQRYVLKTFLAYLEKESDSQVIEAGLRYFTAQILNDEMIPSIKLVDLYEKLYNSEQSTLAMKIALLKCYHHLSIEEPVFVEQIVKSAYKNGILLPWFTQLSQPFIHKSHYRKSAYFTYNGKSKGTVKLFYTTDYLDDYLEVTMRHIDYGMYIGYCLTFYMEDVYYYFQEEDIEGNKIITESGIYRHEQFCEPVDDFNSYDVINTVIMSEWMNDEDGILEVFENYIELRESIKEDIGIIR